MFFLLSGVKNAFKIEFFLEYKLRFGIIEIVNKDWKENEMIKKNEIKNIKITGLTSEGSGVGRIDGMAVFVANAAIGDVLEIIIIKVSKNYAIGKIQKVITYSKDRINVDCKTFDKCGGCVFRHIKYSSEVEIKKQRVIDSLTRIGEVENINFDEMVGAENENHYRNKAQIPVGADSNNDMIYGFYAYKSHRIIPNNECLLQPKIFIEVLKIIEQWSKVFNPQPYNEAIHKGKLRNIYIRYSQRNKELMVCLVVNGNGLKGENELAQMLNDNIRVFKSLIINTNTEKTNVIFGSKCRTVFGSDFIIDNLCGLDFKISPLSFFQVNTQQAEKLYNKVKEYANVSKNDILLDLYCGTGTIGLTMAKDCKTLIGVEIIKEAVENAYENAKINGISNAKFICGDATIATETLKNENIKPNVVIIDPPRKGCDKELLEIIANMNVDKLIYVSCDPATLSRDVKILAQNYNFKLEKISSLDLFPRTSHVECVALMSRNI